MTDSKFILTAKQNKKLSEWLKEPNQYCGAIGGRLTYSFTPTSIGLLVEVTDNLTKEKLDLTDYDDF